MKRGRELEKRLNRECLPAAQGREEGKGSGAGRGRSGAERRARAALTYRRIGGAASPTANRLAARLRGRWRPRASACLGRPRLGPRPRPASSGPRLLGPSALRPPPSTTPATSPEGGRGSAGQTGVGTGLGAGPGEAGMGRLPKATCASAGGLVGFGYSRRAGRRPRLLCLEDRGLLLVS